MFIASFTIAKIWETQVSMDTKVKNMWYVYTHMHTWEYYSGIKE